MNANVKAAGNRAAPPVVPRNSVRIPGPHAIEGFDVLAADVPHKGGRTFGLSDSLWVREIGRRGFIGLFACFAVLTLPVFAFWHRYPVAQWLQSPIAPAAALAVVVVMFTIDCCLNCMINPVYIAAVGGLTGLGFRMDG